MTMGVTVDHSSSELVFEGLMFPVKDVGMRSFTSQISMCLTFLFLPIVGILSVNANSIFKSQFISQYLIEFPKRFNLLSMYTLVHTILLLVLFLIFISIIIVYHFFINGILLFFLYKILLYVFLYCLLAVSIVTCINIYSLDNNFGSLASFFVLVVLPVGIGLFELLTFENNLILYVINNRLSLVPFIPEYLGNAVKYAQNFEPIMNQLPIIIYTLLFSTISYYKLETKVF